MENTLLWLSFMLMSIVFGKALQTIINQNLKIMSTQAELARELRAIKDQNEKSHAEIVAKFAALEQAVIDAGNTSPEVDAALAELKASIQKDDDLVPDEEVPPTEG